jgi:hypothetical protein
VGMGPWWRSLWWQFVVVVVIQWCGTRSGFNEEWLRFVVVLLIPLPIPSFPLHTPTDPENAYLYASVFDGIALAG